ncbi:hypothetical protein QUF79_25020 [Fictibacillus enclensis]|uniref:hypothetical protein n=1 Tax=Fictibacillus enclensis TaxID=1017270 RepID=UPI0025A03B61|nr:hypothetical protein [Fictibacillus enclensis]MDM5201292.1 hypothetical protein [Fictibacillus enclensis]
MNITLPIPSRWGISADVGGRPLVWGTVEIHSIMDQKIEGSINFRGVPIPIQGYWTENTRHLMFDSPYATFSGNLSIYNDPSINTRHFLINGRLQMKQTSMMAGEYGTWVASTNAPLGQGGGTPQGQSQIPPVGAFTTSDYLNGAVNRGQQTAE